MIRSEKSKGGITPFRVGGLGGNIFHEPPKENRGAENRLGTDMVYLGVRIRPSELDHTKGQVRGGAEQGKERAARSYEKEGSRRPAAYSKRVRDMRSLLSVMQIQRGRLS